MACIFLNKNDVENKKVVLEFEKIKTFDELIMTDLEDVVYIDDTDYEYPKCNIASLGIKMKRSLISKNVFFELNDKATEPTRVYRDDFYTCGYVFYRMKKRIKK